MLVSAADRPKVRIVLHGKLRRFAPEGLEWGVRTPAEAVRGLLVTRPDIRDVLAEGEYRVERRGPGGTIVLDENALLVGLGRARELHFFPVAKGRGRGGIKAVVGVVLIIAAIVTGQWYAIPMGYAAGGFAGLALSTAFSVGVGLVLTGAAMMLSPAPKAPKLGESDDKRASFLFNGPVTTSEQGRAIPVNLGESIRVGGVVVGVDYRAEDVRVTNRTTAGQIGGGFSGQIGGTPFALQSKATLRLLYLVSEGPTGGLRDGAKSVFFDGVPVKAADGTDNFEGVEIDERLGLPVQSHIPGFPAVANTVSEGATIAHGTPIVRTVTSPTVDEVAITIRASVFLRQDTTNGDILPTTVVWGVDVRPAGGTWTRVLTDTIKGKNTSPYERTRVVSRGELTAPWEFRVVRDTAAPGSVAVQNAITLGLYTERTNSKLTYPNCHMIMIGLDAEKLGGKVPQISFEVSGVKIPVPRNYTPSTRTYATSGAGTSMGDWDYATFHDQVCGNPAWWVYSFLVNDRWGLGDLIPDALQDVFTLYQIAKYCDELIPDGYGGTRPRYRCATSITEREEAWRAVQTVASAFRGMVWAGGGQVRITADMPKVPVKLLTNANVIDGRFTYQGVSLRARHTFAYCWFNDPTDGWRRVPEAYQDDEAIARYGLREAEVVAFGAYERGQALTAAKWLVESDKRGETMECVVGFDNADLMPGDVVEVADRHYAGISLGGRIISATTTQVTLDRTVEIKSDRTYYLSFIGEVTTYTRASLAWYFNISGVLTQAAINETRYTYDPITTEAQAPIVEPARTNVIRNPRGEGAAAGTPGTMPTNWLDMSGGNGLARQIVGTGTEDGIPYVDVRFSGTVGGGGSYAWLVFDSAYTTAVDGDAWAASAFVKLAAGSLTGIAPASPRIAIYQRGVGGVDLGSPYVAITPTGAALRTQRAVLPATLSAGTIDIRFGFFAEIAAGALDVTFRIGIPQMEQGAAATTPILGVPGSLTAYTRAADIQGSTDIATQRERLVASMTPGEHSVLNMAAPLPLLPVAGSVWLLKEAHTTTPALSVVPRQFSVLSMVPEGEHLFKLTALEHDPTKFARVEQGIHFDAPGTSILPSAVQAMAPPTNVTAQDYVRGGAGSSLVTVVTVSWAASPDLRTLSYEVEARGADGHLESRVVRGLSVDFENLRKQDYTFAVRAVSQQGASSPWAVSATVVVDGVNDPPAAPTSFTVRGGIRELTLLWVNPANLDLAGIQIKRSPDNVEGNATVLKEIMGTQWVDTDKDTLTAGTTWYYWIRARNTSNQYSAWQGPASGTVAGVGVSIESASIATAQIGDLQVSTLKIAGSAVSEWSSVSSTTTKTRTEPGTGYATTAIASWTMSVTGDAKVLILHSFANVIYNLEGGGTGGDSGHPGD